MTLVCHENQDFTSRKHGLLQSVFQAAQINYAGFGRLGGQGDKKLDRAPLETHHNPVGPHPGQVNTNVTNLSRSLVSYGGTEKPHPPNLFLFSYSR